jgi:hypothetical protein
MSETLVGTGLACLIAAIVGGGLKAAGNEFPQIASLRRQLLLGALGLVLVPAGLLEPWKGRKDETRKLPVPVELHGGAGPLQHGFFTPTGMVISTSEAAGAGRLSVHWREDGKEVQAPARVVDEEGRLVLLEVGGDTVPEVAFDVGRAISLQRRERIEAYISPSERPAGHVREVGASREIQDVGTLDDLLVSSPLAGPGDSGAPILDARGRLVAVLYGQSPTEAVSIPIETVRARFQAAF